MTSRDFCYWLQGYFEINDNQPRPNEYSETLNSEQLKSIKAHLAMVFKHEIDPNMGNQQHQDTLNQIHKPNTVTTAVDANGDLLFSPLYRC